MLDRPRTVTFDCWGTLLVQPTQDRLVDDRTRIVRDAARDAGVEVDDAAACAALGSAWARHHDLWERQVASGAPEMARWALTDLGIDVDAAGVPVVDLTRRLEDAALDADVAALDGAVATLEALADVGVRRALICDTGMSPGRIVRVLLDRVGLYDLLEVTTFSNEVGVPKPDARMFTTTLAALGVDVDATVHVGDLRRTDVAGARGAGMGSIRILQHHDDRSDHPEADAVADTHAHLLALLGHG